MAESGLDPTTVERDGRLFSGIGVSEESVDALIEEHKPDHDPETGQPVTPPTSEAQSAPSVPDGSPKPTRGQRRFDELTREREDARREAAALKERLEARERELAEYRRRPAEPSTPPAQAHAEQQAQRQGVPPKPKIDDIGSTYQDFEAYQDARDEWAARYGPYMQALTEQYARLRQEDQQTSLKRELATSWDAAQTRGRKQYGATWDTTVAPLLSIDLDGDVLEAIATHPSAEHVAWQLSQDPVLLQHLAGARGNAARQGLILGRILGTTSGASTASPVVPSSTAPPPMQPVGSGSRTTVPSLEDLAASGDYEGYRARRAQERKAGRR